VLLLERQKPNGEEESLLSSKENPPKNVVTSPQLLIITKLSFCHLELQKCHYGLKNGGPVTWIG